MGRWVGEEVRQSTKRLSGKAVRKSTVSRLIGYRKLTAMKYILCMSSKATYDVSSWVSMISDHQASR